MSPVADRDPRSVLSGFAQASLVPASTAAVRSKRSRDADAELSLAPQAVSASSASAAFAGRAATTARSASAALPSSHSARRPRLAEQAVRSSSFAGPAAAFATTHTMLSSDAAVPILFPLPPSATRAWGAPAPLGAVQPSLLTTLMHGPVTPVPEGDDCAHAMFADILSNVPGSASAAPSAFGIDGDDDVDMFNAVDDAFGGF